MTQNVGALKEEISLYEKAKELDPLHNVSSEYLLNTNRRKAESNLIKAAIIRKLHYDIPLTDLESRYLKTWKHKLSEAAAESNILEAMVPAEPTKLQIGDLSGDDLYRLNSIPNVKMSEEFREYSLSDLVMEMALFLDPTLIEQLEKELAWQQQLRQYIKDFLP